ncbi:MAG: glycosyltransferase family 2 protein [Vicinamibacterales bacterium]
MKLSVVIPVYNEAATISSLIERVRAVDIPKEIIVVDDCSADGTADVLRSLPPSADLTLRFHPVNRGKGAALRTGFQAATGDVVVVQDADLEYDPQEYHKLLAPIADGRADVVYGSRFAGGECHRVLYFWHSIGNKVLTLLSNAFTNLNLTDMETCYKMFRRRDHPVHSARRGSVRVRARGHGKARKAPLSHLRGRHLLLGAHVRGGEEDWLEGRRASRLVHPEVPLKHA